MIKKKYPPCRFLLFGIESKNTQTYPTCILFEGDTFQTSLSTYYSQKKSSKICIYANSTCPSIFATNSKQKRKTCCKIFNGSLCVYWWHLKDESRERYIIYYSEIYLPSCRFLNQFIRTCNVSESNQDNEIRTNLCTLSKKAICTDLNQAFENRNRVEHSSQLLLLSDTESADWCLERTQMKVE